MQSIAIGESPAQSSPRPSSGDTVAQLVLPGTVIGVLWFILCNHLSSEWSMNEQYSYGWFVPFFAAYLFWLRWEDRPTGMAGLDGRAAQGSRAKAGALEHQNRSRADEVAGRNSKGEHDSTAQPRTGVLLPTSVFLLLLLLLPLRLFEGANPDWRPISWLHALAVVVITLAIIFSIGGRPWLRHFGFPVCFILVAVPWVTPIEQPVTQWLMRAVAAFATEVLNLSGVPAEVQGNLIALPSGTVGVNEACSGVRSLQTSVMIGLLFGELKRLSIGRRLALLSVAIGIAIGANFLRALVLVSLEANNAGSSERWHDRIGYSVLGLVFLGTLAAAALLGKKAEGETPTENAGTVAHSLRQSRFATWTIPALVWLLALEAGVELWYRSHEKSFAALPRWQVRWPTGAPGYRELPIDERSRAILLYDEGHQAVWNLSSSATGEPITPNSRSNARCNAFFFRWNPGGTSVVRARAHRPDICLPSAGWKLVSDYGLRTYATSAGIALPFRHFRFVNANRSAVVDTFFCVYEDREVRWSDLGTYRPDDQTSYAARWRNVRHGIRNMGQQVLQLAVFSSSGAASPEQAEAQFAHAISGLISPAGQVALAQ